MINILLFIRTQHFFLLYPVLLFLPKITWRLAISKTFGKFEIQFFKKFFSIFFSTSFDVLILAGFSKTHLPQRHFAKFGTI